MPKSSLFTPAAFFQKIQHSLNLPTIQCNYGKLDLNNPEILKEYFASKYKIKVENIKLPILAGQLLVPASEVFPPVNPHLQDVINNSVDWILQYELVDYKNNEEKEA